MAQLTAQRRRRPSLSAVVTALAMGLLMALIIMISSPAFAALGEDIRSVQADQAHVQGTLRSTSAAAYTVYEIQSASGTTVREYVSASGKVFAVAWHGPWLPDMRQILATYFEPYQRALQSPSNSRPGRRPLLISQPELVVQSAGHLRSFAGRAYVPDMLPQGVTVDEIR